MSAPLAGKFQDHYALLGVDPRANAEAIQAAYTALAKKYRPDNPKTGDKDKFDSVNQAYEVLCDPYLRAEFDKIKGIDQEGDSPQFSGLAFFETLGRQTALRVALLSILYDRRHKKPTKPSLSMRHIDGMLDVSNDELNFAAWYLKQRGLAASDDKSNLQITVEGMDFLEKQRPAAEAVMPFLKPASVSVTAPENAPAPAAPARQERPEHQEQPASSLKPARDVSEEAGSVVGALHRALSRR